MSCASRRKYLSKYPRNTENLPKNFWINFQSKLHLNLEINSILALSETILPSSESSSIVWVLLALQAINECFNTFFLLFPNFSINPFLLTVQVQKGSNFKFVRYDFLEESKYQQKPLILWLYLQKRDLNLHSIDFLFQFILSDKLVDFLVFLICFFLKDTDLAVKILCLLKITRFLLFKFQVRVSNAANEDVFLLLH